MALVFLDIDKAFDKVWYKGHHSNCPPSTSRPKLSKSLNPSSPIVRLKPKSKTASRTQDKPLWESHKAPVLLLPFT